MKAIELPEKLIPEFIEYCNKYGHEQDESYLPDKSFKPGSDDPTIILIEDNKITGAASLILHPEYRELKKGRFRIFHSIRKDAECYSMLLENLVRCAHGIKNVYCFIQDKYEDVRRIWEEIGFEIERYSWVLSRETGNHQPAAFPAGFYLKPLHGSNDEQAFCDTINIAFEKHAGHRHMRRAMIEEFKTEAGYLNDGLYLLWDQNKPVGTMHLVEESENGIPILFIQALSILPGYQGKGLGKNLLRAALEYGERKGYKIAALSVNAENENAANLYIREGFKMNELFICYHKDL
ncbi:MAG: GNAT family N-acetyltransferase [Ignavibacteriae bacterium]|nr:MAG: GNAT family N-acetyltransferase [Ignavibacteriota bacterium]